MFIPVRRSLGIALSLLVLLGPLNQTVRGQFRAGLGMGPPLMNPYVNPLAAAGMFNAASLGRSLQTVGALNSPFGYGRAGMGMYGSGSGVRGMGMGGFGGLGYGSLMNGGMGGYGLIGTALAGAGLGYGYGYGMGLYSTQWMMNPYQGYLQGAASITNANAQYRQTIQQAKLTRQEYIRSSLETRRAMIEEADWERAHMPDPEKIRQQALERELSHARVSPPNTDIWSARSLNALLRHLITQQGEGVLGTKIPLSEDIVKHINVSAGNTRGSVGLIKDNANLDWPESLMAGEFKEPRERINSLMKEAYKSVSSDNRPSDATLSDLQGAYGDLQKTLDANVEKLSPNLFNEAKRYLREIKDTITALKDPNVVNHFNKNWAPNVHNVPELVQFMREKGLRFAPAAPKDRAAYVALHHALAAFDANLPRVASTSGSSGNPDNK